MTRMDPDIAAWQREGSLFHSYDEPGKPGDRLCVETHNVYHHDKMVQVGPYHVHKDIYEGHFYPPKPEEYEGLRNRPRAKQCFLMLIGSILLGIGIGLLLPVG